LIVSVITPVFFQQPVLLPSLSGIAGILLTDKDDMVQKGYSWMLKAATQSQSTAGF